MEEEAPGEASQTKGVKNAKREAKRTACESPLARCVWGGAEFSIKAWAARRRWGGGCRRRDQKEGEVGGRRSGDW